MHTIYLLTEEQENIWANGICGLRVIELEVTTDLYEDGAVIEDGVDVLTSDGRVAFTVWL